MLRRTNEGGDSPKVNLRRRRRGYPSANASGHQLLAEASIYSPLGLKNQVNAFLATEIIKNAPSQGKRVIKYSIGVVMAFPTSRATSNELSNDQEVKARNICPISQKMKNGRYIKDPLL